MPNFADEHRAAVQMYLPRSKHQWVDTVTHEEPSRRRTPKVVIHGGNRGPLPVPPETARRIYASYRGAETIGRLARDYDLGVATVTSIVFGRGAYAYLRTERTDEPDFVTQDHQPLSSYHERPATSDSCMTRVDASHRVARRWSAGTKSLPEPRMRPLIRSRLTRIGRGIRLRRCSSKALSCRTSQSRCRTMHAHGALSDCENTMNRYDDRYPDPPSVTDTIEHWLHRQGVRHEPALSPIRVNEFGRIERNPDYQVEAYEVRPLSRAESLWLVLMLAIMTIGCMALGYSLIQCGRQIVGLLR